ncbi:MAG: hypothetical protein A2V70_20265 [Planctomycetes bacterium RBG_13_63_9]|nr:MAG: hypothetical protein A2V70_20265 [Planctomycetes bacterium RBG_13_63_9]
MLGEERRPPVGGVDYPRTLQEFDEWFPSQAACVEYLERIRWSDGFRCPICGGKSAWRTARGQSRCSTCQRQTSPTAGTIFEGTRKPLRTWFQAMWYVTSQKHLDYYLDEYTFRFNRRRSRAPGMVFYHLLEQSLDADPVAYTHLVGGKSRQTHGMQGKPKM